MGMGVGMGWLMGTRWRISVATWARGMVSHDFISCFAVSHLGRMHGRFADDEAFEYTAAACRPQFD